MTRRQTAIVLVLCLLTGPAYAEDFVTEIVSELRSQGYTSVVVEHTLLARAQIRASRGGATREVVVNPRTGEILRDLRIHGDQSGTAEVKDEDGDDGGADDGCKGRGRGGDRDGDSDGGTSGHDDGGDD